MKGYKVRIELTVVKDIRDRSLAGHVSIRSAGFLFHHPADLMPWMMFKTFRFRVRGKDDDSI